MVTKVIISSKIIRISGAVYKRRFNRAFLDPMAQNYPLLRIPQTSHVPRAPHSTSRYNVQVYGENILQVWPLGGLQVRGVLPVESVTCDGRDERRDSGMQPSWSLDVYQRQMCRLRKGGPGARKGC